MKLAILAIILLFWASCNSTPVLPDCTKQQAEIDLLKAEIARIDSTTPPIMVGFNLEGQ